MRINAMTAKDCVVEIEHLDMRDRLQKEWYMD